MDEHGRSDAGYPLVARVQQDFDASADAVGDAARTVVAETGRWFIQSDSATELVIGRRTAFAWRAERISVRWERDGASTRLEVECRMLDRMLGFDFGRADREVQAFLEGIARRLAN